MDKKFTIVKLDNKDVKIPMIEIENLMSTLELTEWQAIETWLCDNDYLRNDEVDQLTAKAKANKADKIVVADRAKPRAKRNVEQKQNPDKEFLINIISQLLTKTEQTEQVYITNKTKLIEFVYNGKAFKLDLIEKRVKKEKN